MQWQVVESAAHSIAASAEDHGFFCVGDEKQAIYGWRGGSADLFGRLERDIPSLEWTDLATSYRSAPTVIEAVNAVFQPLAANPVFQTDNRESAAAAAEMWATRFTPHSTAKKELTGYVCIRSAPMIEVSEEKSEPDVFGFAARWIASEHAKRPKATIGVLTRKNSGVARMIAELRSLGLRASQEGGNPLTDSTAVQIILAALRFAEHPGDSASRFFVASTPLGTLLGLKAAAVDPNGPAVASAIRRKLLDDGLGSVIADWAEALSPHVGDRDQERLQKLAEFAFVREAEDSLRPDEFVKRIDKQKFEDPSAEPIRVMTIHQAKGLEFDVVMLPELDEKLVGQTPNYISWTSKKGGMTDGVVRYVDKTVQSLLPARIRNAFEDRIVREAQESLCLLYVAVTRAARSLLIVTEPSAANEKTIPLTMAGVLRGVLAPPGPLSPDAVWYENGDSKWRL
jgi:ATP-dependent helicase/nuclease subunit A